MLQKYVRGDYFDYAGLKKSPDDLAHASRRVTVGRYTTEADVDYAGSRLEEVVGRLRRSRAAS